ncbi:methionyl-tRNA formyltransferase [Ignavigranum ruoffiae]|uniref:methionyl-tRNA formyltransferase n=1 Tax=Ignavigranum ruoffiae TaxID=89093 RepID=UPI0020518906|nr:methionyl-tRNA formyltransferase [Ignavigranum ruoffiae]UPQ85416.1 methionyl-tRNA formyltransferase [Ignavigranum ruoffiae]
MRIIFMGTPDFAAEILDGLLTTDHEILAVVTQPDRPKGRKRILTPSPVKVLAQKYHLPVFQPENIKGSSEAEELTAMAADLIITAAYGQFVPDSLLASVKYYAINVHASLLPKYRGGAPIHYAIWQGEEETGISIIEMVSQMDAGDIFYQQAIPILPSDDVGQQFAKLAKLGRQALLDFLPKLASGDFERQPQNPEQVSFAPIIDKEAEQINWFQSNQEIDQHIRAFRPFPSTYTLLKGQRIKIWAGRPVNYANKYQASPGQIVASTDDQLIVACGQDSVFAIEEWQENGRKRVQIKDYLNGNPADDLIGQTFSSPKEGASS